LIGGDGLTIRLTKKIAASVTATNPPMIADVGIVRDTSGTGGGAGAMRRSGRSRSPLFGALRCVDDDSVDGRTPENVAGAL
jgi:hypothetical protein